MDGWCYFQIPMALISVVLEKSFKSSSPARRCHNDDDTDINIAYVLFWCYLFNLLSLVMLFWTDVIPGFGMADGMIDFAEGYVHYFYVSSLTPTTDCRMHYLLFWKISSLINSEDFVVNFIKIELLFPCGRGQIIWLWCAWKKGLEYFTFICVSFSFQKV